MASKAASTVKSERDRATDGKSIGNSAVNRSAALGNFRLKVLVFFAGAVLMGLEIAGSRVLAPNYGNSVFVWGSLITVFLAALSIGYYLGGRLADRYPSPLLLSAICIGVSVWIVGLSFFGSPFCQFLVTKGVSEQTGPLLASLALFLAPSVGMGVVSPFAIRLSASSIGSVGKTSGSLYALSTVGSIAGTIITTFGLIPLLGVSLILRGLGLTLLLSSLLVVPSLKKAGLAGGVSAVMIALVLLAVPFAGGNQLAFGERLVAQFGTPYHNIAVIDHPHFNRRQLRFDQFTESQIVTTPPYPSFGEPNRDDLFYTNYFNLAFLLHPQIERALFIGAGGGIGPRAFHMHDPQMQIDVVDIDPKVLEVAGQYFYLEDVPQIRRIAKDGRLFVRNTTDHYDCILLDAFTIGGRIPFHLVTKEFFTLCHEKLTDDGVFVMNINSAQTGRKGVIYRTIYSTLSEVFSQVYAFAMNENFGDPTQSTNIIFLATNRTTRVTRDEWNSLADAYRSASYVNRQRMQSMVGDLQTNPPDPSTTSIFTDDFAPIETMPF